MYRFLNRAFSHHYPVMYRNVLEILSKTLPSKPHYLFGDATVGAAGHTLKLLEKFPNSYVIGTDLDTDALKIASENTSKYQDRVSLHHSNYTELSTFERFPTVLQSNAKFDAVIIDLGMSSIQLDNYERGFSFSHEGPLDMRFDQKAELLPTAAKIVNYASELELAEIFKKYGEEKDSKAAAEIICRLRREIKIETTTQLSKILSYAFYINRSSNKYESITRCFQALRIKVNDEFAHISKFFHNIFDSVENEGVVIAMCFHSLEEKIVKEYMRHWVIYN